MFAATRFSLFAVLFIFISFSLAGAALANDCWVAMTSDLRQLQKDIQSPDGSTKRAAEIALWKRIKTILRRFPRDARLPADALEDIKQETAIALFRYAREERINEKLEAIARTIYRNNVALYFRVFNKRGAKSTSDPEVLENLPTADFLSSQELASEARSQELRAAIQELDLTPDQRELMRRHLDEDKSVTEITREMGKGMSWAKVSLFRIRNRLTAHFNFQSE